MSHLESQLRTLSHQLEAAKSTAANAEERRLRDMQMATERAQAELTARDQQLREVLIATLRQSAEASREASRAHNISHQEAFVVLKQDLNARVSESHRAIEMLTHTQKGAELRCRSES